MPKKMILKKTALTIVGASFLAGIFGKNGAVNTNATEKENSSSTSNALPSGYTDKDRFFKSLNETEGIEGNLDLIFNLKEKGSSYSVIKTENASLRLARPSTKVNALDLNMSVNYNGVSKAAHLNYTDEVAYFDLFGLKYKYSDSTYKSMVSKIITIFGENALKVPDSIYDTFDSFLSKDTSFDSFSYEEEYVSNGYGYKISIGNNEYVHLEEDADYNLTKVYSDKVTVGESYLSFEFSTTRNDDELTSIKNLIPSDSSSYKEVYDSMDLVRKIHNLASSAQFGVTINGTLHHEIAENNKHKASEEDITLEGNIFADINSSEFSGNVLASPKDDSTTNYNSISFTSLKDDEQKTYLNYNDVMKVAVRSNVLNELIARIKADFGDSVDLLDKLLNLLDESFVSNIKKGRYENIVDAIKSLSNDNNVVKISLNLEGLGFSSESEISIELNANDANLAKITLNNVGLNGFYLNDTTILLTNYQKPSMNLDNFYFLEKIPNIYSQFYDIYSSPKLHLAIEGSYVDSNGVGLSSIKGEANLTGHIENNISYEFDGGYLDILLGQQVGKYDDNNNYTGNGDYKKHHVSLDLEKLETAYFHYYDEDKMAKDSSQAGTYGKMSIGPFEDIITIVKKVYNSDDPRFNKFFKIVNGVAASNVIDALKSGQYSPLLAANLLVSSAFMGDYSQIVLSGKAFGFNDENGDNNFIVTLRYEANNVKVLEISNVVFNGKTLNIKLTLSDYDESKTTVVDHTKTTTDFTSMSALISDLYNTANLKTYHLTSSNIGIYLKVVGLIPYNIILDIDVRLFVDGLVVKAYGTINVPVSSLYSETYREGGIFSSRYSYRNCVLYYDNIDYSNNEGKPYSDNSGYVYLTYNLAKNKTDYSGSKHYGSCKYHTDYLTDTSHLVKFLFKDILDLNSTIYSPIESSITKTDTSGKAMDLEQVISSYAYDESSRKWDMVIAVDALMKGDDSLKNLSVSLQSAYSSVVDGYVFSQGDISVDLNITALSGSKISATIINIDLDNADNWSSVSSAYQTYIDAHKNDAVTAS